MKLEVGLHHRCLSSDHRSSGVVKLMMRLYHESLWVVKLKVGLHHGCLDSEQGIFWYIEACNGASLQKPLGGGVHDGASLWESQRR